MEAKEVTQEDCNLNDISYLDLKKKNFKRKEMEEGRGRKYFFPKVEDKISRSLSRFTPFQYFILKKGLFPLPAGKSFISKASDAAGSVTRDSAGLFYSFYTTEHLETAHLN